jgi:hypothetical protein
MWFKWRNLSSKVEILSPEFKPQYHQKERKKERERKKEAKIFHLIKRID